MQADEDVGKIALAVPVLVSKALELFLQDLCDRTYDITNQKGVKTVSSSHLKQCIQTYNVYDFLREVVSKVPDISSPVGNADDKFRKRKAAEDGSEADLKRTRNESENHTGNRRGRGRGRGRGRRGGRGGRGAGKELYITHAKFNDQSSKPADPKFEVAEEVLSATEAKEATTESSGRACLRNFDLNLDPAEEDEATVPSQTQSTDLTTSLAAATSGPSVPQLNEGAATAGLSAPRSNEVPKLKDFLEWQLPDMNNMTMDPVQYALSTNHTSEADEDYDNEE